MKGDALASGGRSAQFPAGKTAVDAPIELHNVAPEEKLGDGITVIDRRPNWLSATEMKEAPVTPKKYPEKKYSAFTPILDRILVKRCAEGPDMKIMEDGSVLNTKTGLVIAAKYRQHSNIGICSLRGSLLLSVGSA